MCVCDIQDMARSVPEVGPVRVQRRGPHPHAGQHGLRARHPAAEQRRRSLAECAQAAQVGVQPWREHVGALVALPVVVSRRPQGLSLRRAELLAVVRLARLRQHGARPRLRHRRQDRPQRLPGEQGVESGQEGAVRRQELPHHRQQELLGAHLLSHTAPQLGLLRVLAPLSLHLARHSHARRLLAAARDALENHSRHEHIRLVLPPPPSARRHCAHLAQQRALHRHTLLVQHDHGRLVALPLHLCRARVLSRRHVLSRAQARQEDPARVARQSAHDADEQVAGERHRAHAAQQRPPTRRQECAQRRQVREVRAAQGALQELQGERAQGRLPEFAQQSSGRSGSSGRRSSRQSGQQQQRVVHGGRHWLVSQSQQADVQLDGQHAGGRMRWWWCWWRRSLAAAQAQLHVSVLHLLRTAAEHTHRDRLLEQPGA